MMTTSDLANLLSPFEGQRAWLLPLSDESGKTFANNGDLLMHGVFHDICRDLSITLTDDPNGVDFVAVPPNGALLDRFRAPEIVRARLRDHRDRPVVIFPSSAQFLESDPSTMFENRSAPTLWILREPYSLDHLDKHWGPRLSGAGVTLALDHDVVVSGAKYVPPYFPAPREGRRRPAALLVSRLGVEATDIRNNQGSPQSYDHRAGSPLKQAVVSASRTLPAPLLRPARRLTTHKRIRAANSKLLDGAPGSVRTRFSKASIRKATDISDTSLVSFDEYCARVAAAEIVVSNRLHVAIPAALLGKETYLIDSGYHKLRGIYEHSLSHLENLTFVARP